MNQHLKAKKQISFFTLLLLLIIYETICSGDSAVRELVRFNQWHKFFVVAVFLMLLISSVIIRRDGIKAGRRTFRAEGVFLLGWILCCGGIIYANKSNEVTSDYMLWTYLSLSIIPLIWSLWSSFPGGQRALALIIAKAMTAGTYIYVFFNYILTPFAERGAREPLLEYMAFTSHSNTNGMMCGGFAIAAAFLLVAEKKYRIINAVAFALALFGIIASDCRSAEIGMILAFLCGAVYYLRRKGPSVRKGIRTVFIYLLPLIPLCAATAFYLRYTDPVYVIWILCCLFYIGCSLFARGPYRLQSLFFIMSFMMFFTISMPDVLQHPFECTATIMTYLSLGVVAFRRRPTSRIYRIIKRLSDIVIATAGCTLIIPVAALVKIGQIATKDRGPLLYTQTRTGLGGKPFRIYKFRTMNTEADSMLDELLKDRKYREQWISRQKLDDDPRVTRIGRLMRKTSVDELPQLLNVLKGDMSLIGPRPLVPGELEEHGGRPGIYNKIRPGMTGWWICHGHNSTSYKKRLELEYYYVLNYSPALDAICLIRTLFLMASNKVAGEDDIEWEKACGTSFSKNSDLRISVIIPALNGEKHLAGILSSLHRQEPAPDEIIVVDSGSTDNTRKICESDPGVRLIGIRREDFNHGGTRDMALRKSSGDIVVFLTQDATPKGTGFLKELIAPLVLDDVAVSSGRQIAYHNASEAEKLIREYNYPGRSFLRSKENVDESGIKAFFTSNVCGAYRRDIYEKLGGFERDVKTNEDMFFAAKAINSGYRTAYAADAEVYHSHDLSWREQYERNLIQGYEIGRHKDLFEDVSLESEGVKMAGSVALKLICRGRFISLAEFAFDCIARYLGSMRGRRIARFRRTSSHS